MPRTIDAYLEVGSKRVFAGALDWPGWCRSAKDEPGALDALVTYGPRYAAVLAGGPGEGIGTDFEPPDDPSSLTVVERLEGGSGTDFGAPSRAPTADDSEVDATEAERLVGILRASWVALDEAAAAVEGIVLRTGPRGGGRDVAKMLGHVREAEQAYLAKLGSRSPRGGTAAADVAEAREVAVAAVKARALGTPIPDPSRTKVLWSPRYFVRRAAWHLLDHAWEIEDRAGPG